MNVFGVSWLDLRQETLPVSIFCTDCMLRGCVVGTHVHSLSVCLCTACVCERVENVFVVHQRCVSSEWGPYQWDQRRVVGGG